ncbi:MAG: malonyl-CoA decarboxylase family protein [Cellvibrionales bacterium]|jgi:malonyl-CoA decarboxylase
MEPAKTDGKWHRDNPLSRIVSVALATGRAILRQRAGWEDTAPSGPVGLLQSCADLVEHRGEASGLALAEHILDAYETLRPEEQLSFFQGLATDFLIDNQRLSQAIADCQASLAPDQLDDLRRALEPRCNRLFRRLNQVPGATGRLVKLRGDLIKHEQHDPALKVLDDDLRRLLLIWFNLGFLTLRRISWDSSASILEKFIAYEAVHEIQGWADLRSRLKEDRRLFAYFHPAMPDDPIIFVEVALSRGSNSAIGPLVDLERRVDNPETCDTATFYSISNCHPGLRGIYFGNFLIKQVAADLRDELPHLKRFETLSPVPGFRPWLTAVMAGGTSANLPEQVVERLHTYLEDIDNEFDSNPLVQDVLRPLCAHYLTQEKKGRFPVDPVARFHLSNGAMLDRVHGAADTSEAGLARSYGVMVNYVYEPDEIEHRHEAYFAEGKIATSKAVMAMAQDFTSIPS